MRIGRLCIELIGDELFYRSEIDGDYYDLVERIGDIPGDWWCLRVRHLWGGFWWVYDPDCLERRNFYDLRPFYYNWFSGPW